MWGEFFLSGQGIGSSVFVPWSIGNGVVVMGEEVLPLELSSVEYLGVHEVL